MLFNRSRQARSELWQRRARTSGYAPAWRAACEGAGLVQTVQVAAGLTLCVPELVDVGGHADEPLLTIRLLPGQLPADVAALGSRLAPALGAVRLVVEPLGLVHVRLRLLTADPLAEVIRLDGAPIPLGLLGFGEDGAPLVVPYARRPHAVVQGMTGSGKSVFTYTQLAGAAADPTVLVCGIDPTGLLFRPFAGSRHAAWQVSGLGGELAAYVELLEALCAEMDRRIEAMPADRDAVDCTLELPVLLVVLEELPGLYRAADMADPKIGKRVRALVARLLSEGRKAGVRLLLIVQRADAAVVDGLARAQCGLRVSFSVDSREAVAMLHPAVPDVADVLAAAPGVALLTAPGSPVARFRCPLIGAQPYASYVERVRAAVACDGLSRGPERPATGLDAA